MKTKNEKKKSDNVEDLEFFPSLFKQSEEIALSSQRRLEIYKRQEETSERESTIHSPYLPSEPLFPMSFQRTPSVTSTERWD